MIDRFRENSLAPLLVAAAFFVFGLCGCFQEEFGRFNYELAGDEARQFHEPLVQGQELLPEVLRRVDFQAEAVSLGPAESSVLDGPLAEEYLLDETKAVFFKLLAKGRPGFDDILYFNQRTLRLDSLRKIAAAGAASDSGDLCPTGPDRFAIFRSIPLDKEGAGVHGRALFRFDFLHDPERGVLPRGRRRLTAGNGLDFMPVPFCGARRVLYLHKEEDGRHRLMAVDFDGGEPAPLFRDQDFDVLFPRRLADGRLVFSANPDGYYRLYEWKMAAGPEPGASGPGSLTPFAGPFPPAGEQSNKVFTSTVRNGEFQAVLLELPAAYDLGTICALVAAHNPRVNKMRALLAASLIEAGQARLANWPVLDLGLFYTPTVGVFLDKPIVTSGDFLAESIARGLLGIVQPLFDWKRNRAFEQAQYLRAEIARDNVLNEINERLPEAAELYFEARYQKKFLALDEAQLKAMGERLRFYRELRASAESSLEQILATEQILDGIRSERAFHAERLVFLQNRLKELCGLPEGAPLVLADEHFLFQLYRPDSFASMRYTALLHHPDLKAAKAALQRAFFLEKMGPDRRPTAFFNATYGQSRRYFTEPVDDYITLALRGRYPVGSRRAGREHAAFWQETLRALRMERQVQARKVAAGLEEALLDFRAAQRDYGAKKSSVLYQLENLRVARLHREYGAPNESRQISMITAMNARFDYLQALAKKDKTERDMGLRFAKIWREMGLSARLAEESAKWKEGNRLKRRASVWLWRTKEVLASDKTMREFVRFCGAHDIRRVYAYLYSDSRLLAKRLWLEKTTMFINFCGRANIEVWGLLGEPEWLGEGSGQAAADRAVKRVLAFNRGKGPLEPRFSGIKLDLEPHSLAGWRAGPAARRALAKKYIGLIRGTRARLGGALPLWADIPVQFFRPGNKDILAALSQQLDGATLMDYFQAEGPITRHGEEALARFGKPLEIGLEFSEKAPVTDRLPAWSREAFQGFVERLLDVFGRRSNFAGLAFHDYGALVRYFGAWQDGAQQSLEGKREP